MSAKFSYVTQQCDLQHFTPLKTSHATDCYSHFTALAGSLLWRPRKRRTIVFLWAEYTVTQENKLIKVDQN